MDEQPQHKISGSEAQKRWRERHPEKYKKIMLEYYHKNSEGINRKRRETYAVKKNEINRRRRERRAEKKAQVQVQVQVVA